MDHYYTQHPTSPEKERTVTSVVQGKALRFWTSSGVFSARRVDYGSELLLSAVSTTVAEGSKWLDLGCGYGFLGIGLALVHNSVQGVMVDKNERALGLARRNAACHGVDSRLVFCASDGLSAVTPDQSFALVVTNPPVRIGKAILHDWFAAIPAYLLPGGSLWLVLRRQQGAASMQRSLSRWFSEVRCVKKSAGYWILQAIR